MMIDCGQLPFQVSSFGGETTIIIFGKLKVSSVCFWSSVILGKGMCTLGYGVPGNLLALKPENSGILLGAEKYTNILKMRRKAKIKITNEDMHYSVILAI